MTTPSPRNCTWTAATTASAPRNAAWASDSPTSSVPRSAAKATQRFKKPLTLGLRWPVEPTNSCLSNFGQFRRNTGPARAGNRAVALSHAALCRVLDAYPAPLRGAATGPVGAREVAHLLGRPRSAVIASIRKVAFAAFGRDSQHAPDRRGMFGVAQRAVAE